jgi:hypothetical protein
MKEVLVKNKKFLLQSRRYELSATPDHRLNTLESDVLTLQLSMIFQAFTSTIVFQRRSLLL